MRIVSNEILVQTYLELKNTNLTAKKLKVTRSYISTRLNNLRKLGVKIPKFYSPSKDRIQLDVDKLNEIVSKYGPKNVTKKKSK